MTALLAAVGGFLAVAALFAVGAAWAVRRLLPSPPDRGDE